MQFQCTAPGATGPRRRQSRALRRRVPPRRHRQSRRLLGMVRERKRRMVKALAVHSRAFCGVRPADAWWPPDFSRHAKHGIAATSFARELFLVIGRMNNIFFIQVCITMMSLAHLMIYVAYLLAGFCLDGHQMSLWCYGNGCSEPWETSTKLSCLTFMHTCMSICVTLYRLF